MYFLGLSFITFILYKNYLHIRIFIDCDRYLCTFALRFSCIIVTLIIQQALNINAVCSRQFRNIYRNCSMELEYWKSRYRTIEPPLSDIFFLNWWH